jgi:hypothetical protein
MDVLLNEVLNQLQGAGTVRLRFAVDLKLEGFSLLGEEDEVEGWSGPSVSIEASSVGSGITVYGQQLYELDRMAPPPRIGSVNSAVLALLRRLPARFTRNQFESVVPKAMRYNPVTKQFGVQTSFLNIRRAQQAYFSEFKKRGWVVPVSDDKLISIQEFVKDWAVANGCAGQCTASLLPTTDHKIGITCVGPGDCLELPNGPGSATKEERQQIEAWLNDRMKNA